MIIACPNCQLQYDVRAYVEGTQLRCRCHAILTVPAHITSVVRCSSCGGTIDANSKRCNYCQSLISRKTCPKCTASMREEARFCDQCATPLQSLYVELAQATPHNCPRCGVPLFSQTCSGYPIEACAECLGMWISHHVIELIYKDAPPQLQPVAPTGAVSNPMDQYKAPGGAAYIRCLVCNNHMSKTNYDNQSGVIVDFCNEHGVWLDADELNKILQYNSQKVGTTTAARQAPEPSPNKLQPRADASQNSAQQRQAGLFIHAISAMKWD